MTAWSLRYVRYYENHEPGHNKFYWAAVVGMSEKAHGVVRQRCFIVKNWGALGTDGQYKIAETGEPTALNEAISIGNAKMRDGYEMLESPYDDAEVLARFSGAVAVITGAKPVEHARPAWLSETVKGE
jgi:predicted DNA-binding WGR domain protein